jgi:hypothetical protein
MHCGGSLIDAPVPCPGATDVNKWTVPSDRGSVARWRSGPTPGSVAAGPAFVEAMLGLEVLVAQDVRPCIGRPA